VRRGWFIAALVIGVAAIAIAALAMRLSDEDGGDLTASEWADAVCTSLSDWQSSITALADVGAGELTPQSLGERLDEAESATSEMVSELRDLGRPNLEAGDELQARLRADADELEAAFDDLKEGAQRATEVGAAEFLQALAELAPQFQALLEAVEQTVDDLRAADVSEEARAELEQAFASAPACAELRAGG